MSYHVDWVESFWQSILVPKSTNILLFFVFQPNISTIVVVLLLLLLLLLDADPLLFFNFVFAAVLFNCVCAVAVKSVWKHKKTQMTKTCDHLHILTDHKYCENGHEKRVTTPTQKQQTTFVKTKTPNHKHIKHSKQRQNTQQIRKIS